MFQSPRPLSSVLEDSASDSVKSGDGSNTDSGRGHSDADAGDGTHTTGESRHVSLGQQVTMLANVI